MKEDSFSIDVVLEVIGILGVGGQINFDVALVLARTLTQYKEALIWCSGSPDFAVDGSSREGWDKLCAPLLGRKND